VTTRELRQLVEGIRFLERMRAHPVDKDCKAAQLHRTRAIFGKSLMLARPLAAGTEVAAADLIARKPGSGIQAAERARVIGRRLRRAVEARTPLTWEDLE
jgi:sialic acid synthase SpsE